MLEKLGFKYLGIEDEAIFERYYKAMEKPWASSIAFSGMIAWNHSIRTYYKEMEHFLVCIAWDVSRDSWVCLPFFGMYEQESINQTFTKVKAFFELLQVPLIITDISEWMKPYYQAIPDTDWKIINDRGLCDYIYKADDFKAAMDGQKVRYDYRYFIRKYEPTLEIMSEEHREDCIQFLQQVWCAEHSCEECSYGCLKETAKGMFDSLQLKEANGIVVKKDGKIIAYCFVTYGMGQGIYLFKKTERGYRGINEYLHRECYERFLQEADIINYTEDMDLEGLRKYKEKLAPYYLEPRYELQLKE